MSACSTLPSSLLRDLRGLGACSRRSRRLARVSKTDEVPDTDDSRGDGLAAGDHVAVGDCVAAPANAGSSLESVEAAPRLLHLFVNGWRAVPRTGDDPTDGLPAVGEGYARIAVQGGIISLLYAPQTRLARSVGLRRLHAPPAPITER